MVFPSLLFKTDPGLISQFTGVTVLAFAYVIKKFKKLFFVSTIILLGTLAFTKLTHAFAVFPNANHCYPNSMTSWCAPFQNNYQFYGPNWGMVPPIYFFPGLNPMYQYPYFSPYMPSPYGPGMNCPTCNIQGPYYQPFFQQNPFNAPAS